MQRIKSLAPFFALVCALCAPVGSGAVYRCGNTFSNVPCAEDAKPMKGLAAGGGQAATGMDVSAVCFNAIKNKVAAKDPDALKLASASTAKPDIVEFQGKRLMGYTSTLEVSERQANGAYADPKPYFCATSDDRQRVLQIKAGTQ